MASSTGQPSRAGTPRTPSSSSPSDAPVLVSERFNDPAADLVLRSTFYNPGYPYKKQPITLFRVQRDPLIIASPVFARILAQHDDPSVLLRTLGDDPPIYHVEEGCKTLDMLLRLITSSNLSDFPDLTREHFVDVMALLDAAAKYKVPLVQIFAETVLIHRATDTPAKDALDLYCKAVALNREELAKAACKGIIKTKFSELPEDVLKTLPSSAIIALVKSYDSP